MRDVEEVQGWQSDDKKGIELLEVVKQAKPTILIGCSTMAGAFSEKVRPGLFFLPDETEHLEE